MIKNNNKGYFLTEVIIAITIVAIAITVLYVNSMNTYIKQKNELTRYNTLNGIYVAGEVKKYFKNQDNFFKAEVSSNKFVDVFDYFEKSNIIVKKDFFDELNISKIYYTNYDIRTIVNNLNIISSIKKDLKSLKYNANACQYRYIVIFNDNSYSTIGVDCYE